MNHLTDDQAQRFVDGAVDAAEREACQGHLDACGECAVAVESYRALAEALDALPAPEPAPDFTAGVLARIDARERHLAWERRAALAILGATAALALAVFAAAGAGAWAPALSGLSTAAGRAASGARLALDVAAPVVRGLRLQLLLACAALALPLLLALRRLAAREPAAVVSAP